jgi:hypothetical protein
MNELVISRNGATLLVHDQAQRGLLSRSQAIGLVACIWSYPTDEIKVADVVADLRRVLGE